MAEPVRAGSYILDVKLRLAAPAVALEDPSRPWGLGLNSLGISAVDRERL